MNNKAFQFIMLYVTLILNVDVYAYIYDDMPISYSNRIDTVNDKSVKLWTNYLQSRPDSIYENPFWLDIDRNDRFSFDPARIWIFQNQEMLKTYKPMILSSEEVSPGLTMIKTLFINSSDTSKKVSPLALYRVYVQLKDSGYVLKSALQVETKSWESRKMNGLTFILSPLHKYTSSLARKSARFCDSLTALFDLPDIEGAKIYVLTSKDELASILGFDYFIAPPFGLTYAEKDIVLTALNSEWHPHELAHLIFRSYSKTHRFFQEGVATWCGGSLGQSLLDLTMLLKKENEKRGQPLSFKKVLQAEQNESLAYYTYGALIFKEVFEQRGGRGVKNVLIEGENNNKSIEEIIANALGISVSDIDDFLQKSLYLFIKNNTINY